MLKPTRDLLSESFSIYRANFWLLIGFAAWILLPLAAFLILDLIPNEDVVAILAFAISVIQIFITIWMATSIMRLIAQIKRKQSIDPSKASSEAIPLMRPVFFTALLQALAIVGGLILFIIPGIIFGTWFAMSQASAAIDKKNPIDALSFSKNLVQGRFFEVFWRVISGPFIIGLIYAMIFGMITIILATVIGVDMEVVYGTQPPTWVHIIDGIGNVFLLPVLIVYSVVLYEHLKNTQKPKKLDIQERVA